MKTPKHTITLFAAVLLVGCASSGPSPAAMETKPAPAPSNLTPEQKAQYDEAIRASQPPTGK